MITLACIGHSFTYEMECTLRLFFPGEKVAVMDAAIPEGNCVTASVLRQVDWLLLTGEVRMEAPACGETMQARLPLNASDDEIERTLAVLLFRILCAATDTRPPWGILTGVRPVRLCRQWEGQGKDKESIRGRLQNDFLVQPQKVELTLKTGEAQREILAKNTSDSYSLYISIPFCPTRCLYCSFVSSAIGKMQALVPEYVRLLCREIEETAKLANAKGMRLHTVYMGGGTPTSLSAEQLVEILSTVERCFDFAHLKEYTVEAGRPDTITKEKLKVLRDFDIGRISINPQTMDDTILMAIGRGHTVEQVLKSYDLARSMGFSAINMDLIAGLPGENFETFAHTLGQILELRPENVTLHTLTVKRSSNLRERKDAFAGNVLSLNMLLEQAQNRLDTGGYHPYYLYRQKGTVQNLENTGFTLPGFAGIYNVYSMEEVHTILAVGAGGVTKLCSPSGDIQRVFNYKYPLEYTKGFDEILVRKALIQEWNI